MRARFTQIGRDASLRARDPSRPLRPATATTSARAAPRVRARGTEKPREGTVHCGRSLRPGYPKPHHINSKRRGPAGAVRLLSLRARLSRTWPGTLKRTLKGRRIAVSYEVLHLPVLLEHKGFPARPAEAVVVVGGGDGVGAHPADPLAPIRVSLDHPCKSRAGLLVRPGSTARF